MALHDNLHLITHPITQDRLTRMRDESCPPELFRRYMTEIARILTVEATRQLPVKAARISTPLTEMDGVRLKTRAPLIIPILRAGLGLARGLEDVLPEADTGHIGLYRNEETLAAVEYLVKLPSSLNRPIFICDPMLATAGSMIATIDTLIAHGAKPENITIITLLCAPEGVQNLRKKYKNISLYTAAVDSHLNQHAYIVPGLGDAGDRLFGTF